MSKFILSKFLITHFHKGISTRSYARSAKERAKFYPAKLDCFMPKNCFEGKVAFITGGGTGLGKGISTLLSKLGANVVIGSRKFEVVKAAAEEISQLTNNKVLAVPLDVRDPEAIKAAVDECEKSFGVPDIVVNNAAGNFISPTERLSPNAWRTVIDIVLNGTFFVTADVGKRMMKAQKGGAFLAISAGYAQTGSGFVVPSACAKAGVEIMTKSLAAEWDSFGIRFNCISSGFIETKAVLGRLVPDPSYVDVMLDRTPAGRLGEVEELANLAAYLLSDYASWINGATVSFDGGYQVNISGGMNPFKEFSPEQWDSISSRIKKVRGS